MLDNLDSLIGFALIFTVVSLLVTIVVQLITTALSLRGYNLRWALAETFEAIAPTLKAESGALGMKIANHVLRDELLSDKQFLFHTGLATAVRSDELFGVLHRMATGERPGASSAVRAGLLTLFTRLGIAVEANPIVAALESAVAAMPEGKDKTAALAALQHAKTEVAAFEARIAAAGGRTAELAEKKLQDGYHEFEMWLTMGQERAQEWFTTHCRYWTFFVGLTFAFALQLDTIEIFKHVSSNRALRDQLVAQTQVVLGQAEKITTPTTNVFTRALDQWKASQDGKTKEALAGLVIGGQETREGFFRVVRTRLTTVRSADVDAALTKLGDELDRQIRTEIENQSATYKTVKADLDKTGFALFPAGHGRWDKGWWNRDLLGRHGLGMLFSVLLLSLGAPFWFNLLKSLSNLRSMLANNIAAEDKAEQQKPENQTGGSKAPPIVKARA